MASVADRVRFVFWLGAVRAVGWHHKLSATTSRSQICVAGMIFSCVTRVYKVAWAKFYPIKVVPNQRKRLSPYTMSDISLSDIAMTLSRLGASPNIPIQTPRRYQILTGALEVLKVSLAKLAKNNAGGIHAQPRS